MWPDFLCIGAQKGGTSWLYTQLARHPDLWLPPRKEIHYFDTPRFPRAFLLFSRSPNARYVARYNMRLACRDQQNWRWYARYYFLPRSDRWYASLFAPDTNQFAAEITPAYARLPLEVIARIAAKRPDMKLIYLLRHPLDRMWSQAAKELGRSQHHGIHATPTTDILGLLRRPDYLANSRYLSNLRRWQHFFPSQQIFIGFFEQISSSPQQLLTDIFRFLGVKNLPLAQEALREKINAGDYPPMPDEIARSLARLLVGEIEGLHDCLNNEYTAQWLASTRLLLADQGQSN